MALFEQRLSGGHPNSLGNTIEVVEEVLSNNDKFDDLFSCYFSDDEIVRLRVSNAIKRIAKEKKSLILPYLDQLLDEVSLINQASAQWTLSQLFLLLQKNLTEDQTIRAKEIMKNNLVNHSDWIVLNETMRTLSSWSIKDDSLKEWLRPQLKRLTKDNRKSVFGRAQKLLAALDQ